MRYMLGLMVGLVFVSLCQAGQYDCSRGEVECLRDSIRRANASPANVVTRILLLGGDTVIADTDNGSREDGFNAFPPITSTIILQGAGVGDTVITRDQAAPFLRFFLIRTGGTLVLRDLTLAGGSVDPVWNQRGGAITNTGGVVIGQRVELRDNSAMIGGAYSGRGTLILEDCAVTGNFADFAAGGVANFGPLTVTRCLFQDNISESGGALGVGPGTASLVGSVIDHNLATDIEGGGVSGVGELDLVGTVVQHNASGVRGGGISLTDGRLLAVGSSIRENTGAHFGGGVWLANSALVLFQSEVVRNRVAVGNGGGVFLTGTSAVLAVGSRISGNTADQNPDCAGGTVVAYGSTVGDPSGCQVIPVGAPAQARR